MQHAFIQCISVYIILYVLLIIVHEPGVLGKLRCRMARKRFIIFLYMYILSIYTVRPGVLHERLVRHSHWYHLNVCNINTWEYNCSEWKQRTRYIFFIMKLHIGNVKWESNLVNGEKKKLPPHTCIIELHITLDMEQSMLFLQSIISHSHSEWKFFCLIKCPLESHEVVYIFHIDVEEFHSSIRWFTYKSLIHALRTICGRLPIRQ